MSSEVNKAYRSLIDIVASKSEDVDLDNYSFVT
jgi:hypothetical protein